MIVQQLAKGDFAQRRDLCEYMLAILTEDPHAVVMMSDEAHFHLNGFVNKQNCRFWAAKNPRELNQRPLHSSYCLFISYFCASLPNAATGWKINCSK